VLQGGPGYGWRSPSCRREIPVKIRFKSFTRSIAAIGFSLLFLAAAFARPALPQSDDDASPDSKKAVSKLSVSPTKLTYSVNLDKVTSETKHFTIANKGTLPMTVTVGAPSGTDAAHYTITFPTEISPAGGTLALPGSISQEVEVEFTPTGRGTDDGTIGITSSATSGKSSSATVTLKGKATQKKPTPTATATVTVTPTPTATATPTPTTTPTPARTAVPTSTPTPGNTGYVMGGVNPVSNSSVAMWAAGTSGYGTGATQLATATSAADGSFTIALTCPSASAEIYLIAQGGNAGGGSNSSLMMMEALGPCGSIITPGIINEVTTAGAVYALAQFLSTTSSGMVGAPSTNATGLANAFATVANLVNVTNETAQSTTPGGAGTAPQQNLNSIANALAACVQTNGASSAQCTELFACALPGAVFSSGACSGGAGSIADTLAAALSIALNPASVSVSGVNDVATQAALFSPSLAFAPNDWSMPLNFGPSGSNLVDPPDVAIDSSGHVWVPTYGGNAVTALNNDGTLFGNFAPPGRTFTTHGAWRSTARATSG
jgi:hypothetical protein